MQEEQRLCISCNCALSVIEPLSEEALKIEQLFYGKAKIEKVHSSYHFIQGGACQSLIHHLKYHNAPKIGIEEGFKLGEQLKKIDDFKDIDAIIAVPMTAKKRRKRGYNQSVYIAKGLEKSLNRPQFMNILKRKVQKRSQTHLNKFTRWQNMNESFELKKQLPTNIKHILLVDDVITTGATLESCANAIHQNHDVKISIASIAFAPLQA
ncbi:MAG: ComF family protein [Flavobacteriales bacterium]